MFTMIQIATLVVTTLAAAAAAVLFDWLLLRVVFHLLRPAALRKTTVRTELAQGVRQLAEAFAPHR